MELELLQPLRCDRFVELARHCGKSVRAWRDGSRWYLCAEEGRIHLRLWNRYSNVSNKIVFNPTRYETFLHLTQEIKELLGDSFSGREKIRRCDLAVNVQRPFSEVRLGLDVKFKKFSEAFTSGEPTGLNIGKGEERIVVYDYGLRHGGLPSAVTRVEAQLRGRRLPVKEFCEIDQLPKVLREKNTFSKVQLYNIDFAAPDSVTTLRETERLTRLKTSFDLIGYSTGRRYLNRNGNFDRDYGHLFRALPSPISLQEKIIRHVESFFDTQATGDMEQCFRRSA